MKRTHLKQALKAAYTELVMWEQRIQALNFALDGMHWKQSHTSRQQPLHEAYDIMHGHLYREGYRAAMQLLSLALMVKPEESREARRVAYRKLFSQLDSWLSIGPYREPTWLSDEEQEDFRMEVAALLDSGELEGLQAKRARHILKACQEEKK